MTAQVFCPYCKELAEAFDSGWIKSHEILVLQALEHMPAVSVPRKIECPGSRVQVEPRDVREKYRRETL